ncbi:MAG: hypothetical protein R3F34_13580 [Planctomycetota bacterium]
MPVWKWLLLDGIGASIMVGYTLYLGRLFGENAPLLKSKVERFDLVLMFLAFAVVTTLVVRHRSNKARAEAEAEAASEPGTDLARTVEPYSSGTGTAPAPSAPRDEPGPGSDLDDGPLGGA